MGKPKLIKRIKKPRTYRDGAEGFIKWCEDFVYIPIYPEGSDIAEWVCMGDLPYDKNPETGRSYQAMWEEQKKICREALKMKNGRFVYRLIVFCWMRGEGKSFLACLIQLWKFFNWPRQQIMLGANSKEQIKFVHFDIMKDIILNSPDLLSIVGGAKNVKEKEIRIRNKKGEVVSFIRSISSFTGIVSNITGYTFSEMFDMKNPKFFTQLDGSIRNVPNALGVIDSTVSDKQHVLYQLYMNALVNHTTRNVYFSYRFARKGTPDEYTHPLMNDDQLNDYRAKFPFGEFERYFQNLWTAGQQQVFNESMIAETRVIACDGGILNHGEAIKVLYKKHELLESAKDFANKGLGEAVTKLEGRVSELESRLVMVDNYYQLVNPYNMPERATIDHLLTLGDLLDTDWAIVAGVDFGDPYATSGLARTITGALAKGLPGSRSNPHLFLNQEAAPPYVYFLMHLVNVEDHSLDSVKEILDTLDVEYDGIDSFCSERFGAWDVANWCEDRGIYFEPVFPSYQRQKEAFNQFYNAIEKGRFKLPALAVNGSKKEDIVREELTVFMHHSHPPPKWFGSPEKMERHGIQDDAVYMLAWAMYGGRNINVDQFRLRGTKTGMFGWGEANRDVVATYS